MLFKHFNWCACFGSQEGVLDLFSESKLKLSIRFLLYCLKLLVYSLAALLNPQNSFQLKGAWPLGVVVAFQLNAGVLLLGKMPSTGSELLRDLVHNKTVSYEDWSIFGNNLTVYRQKCSSKDSWARLTG